MKKATIYLLFSFGLFFQGFAQSKSVIDSTLERANFVLYEHPERTVKIGIGVLNSKKATETQKIDALLLISTAYSSQRNYSKSLDYTVRATNLLPKIDNDAFKIIAYSRLGLQYQQLKIYNKAHAYLDKAISVAGNTKQKFDIHKLLGFNYAIRGMVYKEQMSCDIARNYFNKSLYHYSKSPKKSINDANLSVIVYNKGNCFLASNAIDSAYICFTKSYQYADKIGANSLKAFANKGLAEVKTFEGKYKDAIVLLLAADQMSKNVGDLILNQAICKGLSDNYMLTNENAKHELYYQKYESATQRIQKNNAQTLNKFVLQIEAEGDQEIDGINSDAWYCKIPLAAVLVLLLMLLAYEIYRAQKKYAALKAQREALENPAKEKD